MVNKFHIVFTDLDGTLLDHDTYSHDASVRGLEILKIHHIPLIMISSKTFDEMKTLHIDLELNSPFIFENGGGLAFPKNISGDYSFRIKGLDTTKLKMYHAHIENEFGCGIRFICDISIEELISATALPEHRARLAQMRKVSAPFILTNSKKINYDQLQVINEHLQSLGIIITKGGRFFHIMSSSVNKGSAMEDIVKHYEETMPDVRIVTIGIGDSENDIPFLEKVDKAYLVRKKNGSHISTGLKNFTITTHAGPAGFSEAIINEFDPSPQSGNYMLDKAR